MKKWIIFVLALVVMAGSVLPCCIEDNCQDEITASSPGESDEKGNCSPFFTCGTCAGFVQITKQVTAPKPFPVAAIHQETPVLSFTSSYYSSFFQPPRVW